MKIALLTSGGIAPCLSASVGRLAENYLEKFPEAEIIGYLNGDKGLLLGNSIKVTKNIKTKISNFYSFGGRPLGNS
jgi:pyrophosphate--fructose-6-phosphate 1-phosphotransferase